MCFNLFMCIQYHIYNFFFFCTFKYFLRFFLHDLLIFSYSKETGLTLRSDIKLPHVPDDPNVAFVFLIEYTLSLSNTMSGVSILNLFNFSLFYTLKILLIVLFVYVIQLEYPF